MVGVDFGTCFHCLNGLLLDRVDLYDAGGVEDHIEDPPEHDIDLIVPVEHVLKPDDIRLVFHPNTGIPPQYYHFDDYCGTESTPDVSSLPQSPERGEGDMPWRPFSTKLDFEMAEVMLDAHMNAAQIKRMLALVHEVVRHPETFTLVNLKHLSDIWDVARKTRTEMVSNTFLGQILMTDLALQFSKKTIRVQYKDEELEYDVYLRPIWSWCLELLRDKGTVSQFVWDAQRLYRWTETRFERLIDEPWTADAWWNFQVILLLFLFTPLF